MTSNRVKLLETIGFVWKAPRGARRKTEKGPWSNNEQKRDDELSAFIPRSASISSDSNIANAQLESLRGALNPDLTLQGQALSDSLYPRGAPGLLTNETRGLLLQRAALRYKNEVLQLLDPTLPILDGPMNPPRNQASDLSVAAALKMAASRETATAATDLYQALQQGSVLNNPSSLVGSTLSQLGIPPQLNDSERLKQLLLSDDSERLKQLLLSRFS